MAKLRKDHILGAGAAGVAGAATGAAIGSVLGPAGIAVGAAAGGAAGAVAGDRLAERLDPRGDLGRFQQIYTTAPYYVAGMGWEDYRPAYQYGVARAHLDGPWDPQAFARDWPAQRRGSRLDPEQAHAAAEHAHRHVRQGQPGNPAGPAGP